MSLSNTIRNRIVDGINTAFTAIGLSAETKMPRAKKGDNQAPIAWELYVSDHLMRLAKARNDAARRQAIDAGIMFDHERNPREPGTNEQLYNGEHVAVWVIVNKGSTRVDYNKMVTYLASHGVNQKVIDGAVLFGTSVTRPAHSFKVALVAPEGK